jgi:hypothetical protein
MTDPAQLYESDYVAWIETQVAALRQLAQSRPDPALDLEHLIDEVESLARADRAAARSQTSRVIEHLLKLEHSASDRARLGWRRSVLNARLALADRLTPTVRRELEERLGRISNAPVRLQPWGCATTTSTRRPRRSRSAAPTPSTRSSIPTGIRAQSRPRSL